MEVTRTVGNVPLRNNVLAVLEFEILKGVGEGCTLLVGKDRENGHRFEEFLGLLGEVLRT